MFNLSDKNENKEPKKEQKEPKEQKQNEALKQEPKEPKKEQKNAQIHALKELFIDCEKWQYLGEKSFYFESGYKRVKIEKGAIIYASIYHSSDLAQRKKLFKKL